MAGLRTLEYNHQADRLATNANPPGVLTPPGSMDGKQTPVPLSLMEVLIRSQLEGVPGGFSPLEHSQDMLDRNQQRNTPTGTNTFLGNVENIRGVNDGRPTIVPSFIDGVALPVGEKGPPTLEYPDGQPTERALQAQRDRADWVRNSGKVWPSADTIEEAVLLEKLIHALMDMQVPRTP
tara:strand:+ start:9941 stop:10477 length:537 start_codon:yes stop_codon:yes gene_type:complete